MTADARRRDGSQRRIGSRVRNTIVALGCGVVVMLVMGLAVALDARPPTAVGEARGTPSPPPAPPSPRPSSSSAPLSAPSSAPSSAPAPTPSSVPPSPETPPDIAATPAPTWLGIRTLGPAGSGPVSPQVTPPELVDRRIITSDLLPPPTTAEFRPQVSAVPPDVLARSTWQPACPVTPDELRYVVVPHWGFDDRLHTGELIVHADAVDAVVSIFAAMADDRFPLEEVRIIRADELDDSPTGDGNVTSAFVCRPAVGSNAWSQHAYGRALDINPFHNPYDKGVGADRVVLPELATAYTDRDRLRPGMLVEGSAAVRAADAAGWGWGGRWDSSTDPMHVSHDAS